MAVQDNLLALLLTVVLLVDRSSSGEYELLKQLYTASTKAILITQDSQCNLTLFVLTCREL